MRANLGDGISGISSLSKGAVHRICSGQVVTDLKTAVKELVENALDAGATSVAIALVDDGATSIEVTDNGSGIRAADYATTCRKHCTSKLSTFEDLSIVDSFGFRGEALSSLCALAASVKITTRHVDAKVGATLLYDRAGGLASQTLVGRAPGTTVEICGLFKPLPVRHRQFKQKIASQFARLLSTLQAYAVIHTNCRITVKNRKTKNGRTTTCIATQSSTRVEENVAAVFGSKFLSTLVRVSIAVPLDAVDIEASSGGGSSSSSAAAGASASTAARIEGLVSRSSGGIGRKNNSRQFLFINRRPVDVAPLTAAIDSTWRKYEMKQKPAFFLQLHLDPSLFDVNVTPDKRKVLLSPTIQEAVVEALRDALIELWAPVLESKTFITSSIDSFLPPVAAPAAAPAATPSTAEPPTGAAKVAAPVLPAPPSTGRPPSPAATATSKKRGAPSSETAAGAPAVVAVAVAATSASASASKRRRLAPAARTSSTRAGRGGGGAAAAATATRGAVLTRPAEVRRRSSASAAYPLVNSLEYDATRVRARWLARRERAQANDAPPARSAAAAAGPGAIPAACSAFAAEVNEADATRALEKTFEKDWFERMTVVGQFNLGFIIARLRTRSAASGKAHDDLWILDQHACDEKHRYETMKRSTKIHGQPLFCPLKLVVSASEEAIIKSNLTVFARNGFEIGVDETQPLGSQLTVSQVPFSKGVTFGVDDIQELASLIEAQGGSRRRGRRKKAGEEDGGGGDDDDDDDDDIPRLPKLHSVFASRACRSAVMVGTPLTHRKQQEILGHLTGLANPWSCPHGRPTMRHLVDLHALRDVETKASSRAAAGGGGAMMATAEAV